MRIRPSPFTCRGLDLEADSMVYIVEWREQMAQHEQDAYLRIGTLAARAGLSTDAVRYYERLGLLKPPDRTTAGYRQYTAAELRRLQFIRRAKLLGLSLDEIRGLLDLAEEGACHPLREQVTELLQRNIEACELQLAELAAFKASLEERLQQAIVYQHAPACQCASFPASCACLPVPTDEISSPPRGRPVPIDLLAHDPRERQ